MKIFDMHCDTLTTAIAKKQSLYENNLHIDFKRLAKFDECIQVFAIWLDEIYYKNAFIETKNAIDYFKTEYSKYKHLCPNLKPILSVEGGEAIEDDLENIKRLKNMGVKLITICWNYKNKLGCGALSGYDEGLSAFGTEAVKEMERLSIIPDVSHLNEKGFWDLYENTKKPFFATHSNAFSVYPHKRNLNDKQIKAIADRGGLIGINIYNDFVSGKDCTIDNIIPHIKHIINIGGADVLALGCDFDGIDKTPSDLTNISDMPILYNKISSVFGDKIADKIFYENAAYKYKTF